MRNTFRDCVTAVKENKKYRKRVISVLLVLSMVVSVNVFWMMRQQGITMAGDASCGYEEHIHKDECFTSSVICTSEEDGHTHTDECYEKTLICTKQEHTHGVECYSDESADVETQLDWQQMAQECVTGELRKDIVAVAEKQVGYTESLLNYKVGDDMIRRGYTRYGAWYGAEYSDWSAMMVSFCLHYAGSPTEDTPYNIGSDTMATLWEQAGRTGKKGEYTPEGGDVVFFNDNTSGIISSVNGDIITVIKGDVENAVCKYDISCNDESISVFGISVLPEKAEDELQDEELPPADGEQPEDAAQQDEDQKTEEPDPQEVTYTQITVESPVTSGGGVNNIAVTGLMPEGITVAVNAAGEDLDETDEKLQYINANDRGYVNWCMVYDITLTRGEDAFEPKDDVEVTLTFDNLPYDENEEFLMVAHLDSGKKEVLSLQHASVSANSVTFTADSFSPYMLYTIDTESAAGEKVQGTNWMETLNDDYFNYWEQFLTDEEEPEESPAPMMMKSVLRTTPSVPPSNVQIDDFGGETVSEHNDGVKVSKTIAGTDTENVFDITLTVQTREVLEELYEDPDMAVVIVMDISNTMKEDYGNTTRYAAAIEAAEAFIDKFQEKATKGISKVGYVAFNTHAHKIFDLSPVTTTEQAAALKNTMRTETGAIINAAGYKDSPDRFTNIEGGLEMGYDMLESSGNAHKYIIFLSDGFPTTYLNNSTTDNLYDGCNPYTPSGTVGEEGVFYDGVRNIYCSEGTSYSDTAAVKAREMATSIKNNGVKIFSIGVNVSGQTIQKYIDACMTDTFSIVECGDGTLGANNAYSCSFEIGSASNTAAYTSWLQNKIGSGEGYYYDSNDASGLTDAYTQIFNSILQMNTAASEADWVTSDPIPVGPSGYLEFIGFYNKDNDLQATNADLSGSCVSGGEDTAVYNENDNTIRWDLKKSGFASATADNVTTYSYELKYRVRLTNEQTGFVENKVYDTNGPTELTYRVFTRNNDNGDITAVSEQRTIAFEIPAVHGFLADLSFKKTDQHGDAVAGAEFSLTHDTAKCSVCRGDSAKTHVNVPVYTATSDGEGNVEFANIPSGHEYILEETKAPDGYVMDTNDYPVTIAYDVITHDIPDGKIVNQKGAEFPATGGSGVLPYIFTGVALIVTSVVCGYIRIRKRAK